LARKQPLGVSGGGTAWLWGFADVLRPFRGPSLDSQIEREFSPRAGKVEDRPGIAGELNVTARGGTVILATSLYVHGAKGKKGPQRGIRLW